MKHLIFLFVVSLIGLNFPATASLSSNGLIVDYQSCEGIDEELKNNLLDAYELIKRHDRDESIHAITQIIDHLDPVTSDLEYLLLRMKTTKYALIKRKYSMAETLMKNTLIKLGII
jgi:hypothetical protein